LWSVISVEDFEKQTPSTIPQNQHAAKENVDNKYFPLGHTDEKNYQSRQRLNNINTNMKFTKQIKTH